MAGFCSKCGAALGEGVRFCAKCGQPVKADNSDGAVFKTPRSAADKRKTIRKKSKPKAEKMMQQGKQITDNIYLCEDGKYRWVYEMPVLRKPTIFILVWKILFFILLGIFVFITIVDAVSWSNFFIGRAVGNLMLFVYFIIGMTVILGISMLVYAAIMGGKYIVMFEMDDRGINHKQLPAQVKKAQAVGLITALAGIAAHSPTTVGIGLNAASRTEMYSEFSKVRSVKAYPRIDLIKVNEFFWKNQVYAAKEDFDFVKEYIVSHCTNLKKGGVHYG